MPPLPGPGDVTLRVDWDSEYVLAVRVSGWTRPRGLELERSDGMWCLRGSADYWDPDIPLWWIEGPHVAPSNRTHAVTWTNTFPIVYTYHAVLQARHDHDAAEHPWRRDPWCAFVRRG